jgi:pyridoxine kinase
MAKQKRVAAIHDISGFGKCSLTVALPILSAAGIETSIMPTAVLSTHTGGFTGYTYRDLTQDMRPFMNHWKSLGIEFDSIYSGFLGSFEQLEIVAEFYEKFKTDDNIILADPAMADNGKLYKTFTPDFPKGMVKLCSKADIIVPNITEAVLMLGESYREGPYKKEYIEKLLRGLAKLGPRKIVLTGVYFEDEKYGAASYDSDKEQTDYAMSERIEGFYHGTGDVYASALLAALLNGKALDEAMRIAVDFTHGCIMRTKKAATDVRFGVNFEAGLPRLIKQLGLY